MRANLPNNVQGNRASAPNTPEANSPAQPPALPLPRPAPAGRAAESGERLSAFLHDRSAAMQAALMAALPERQGSGDTTVPAREPVLGSQGGTGAQHSFGLRRPILAPAPQGLGLPRNPAARPPAQPDAMAAPSRARAPLLPTLDSPVHQRDEHNFPNLRNFRPRPERAGSSRSPATSSAGPTAQPRAMAARSAASLPFFPNLDSPENQPSQRNLPHARIFRTPQPRVELLPRRPVNPPAERQAAPDARNANADEVVSTPPPR